MDHVEVIVEKEMYARDGVHKGMQGWITEPENINGYWLVNFPQCGEKNDIATIPVREEDVKPKPLWSELQRGYLCLCAAISEFISAPTHYESRHNISVPCSCLSPPPWRWRSCW